MPGMDGFELVERIRKEPGVLDMTIMMLTSDGWRGDIARCRELGISRILVKPVKRSDLLHAITTSLGPMGAAVQERSPGGGDGAADQRPLRLLLAEDSEDNRLVVQAYLKGTAYRMDIAENGEIALQRFSSDSYDLVLMDMQMPVMDGYTATREMRRREGEAGASPTPIIALTASAFIEAERESLEAGCTAHITKPLKKARLIETILEYTNGAAV